MRAVVDTNVVAYYLLETEPFIEECKRFWRAADELMAPASWQSELVNVLWLAVRQKIIPESEAQSRLNFAATLSIQPVAVVELWEGALSRVYPARRRGISCALTRIAPCARASQVR